MEPLKQISPAVTETSGEEVRGIAEIVAIVGNQSDEKGEHDRPFFPS